MSESPNPGILALELLAAAGSALLANYARGRADPQPFSAHSLFARCCEAIACGSIAAGLSSLIEAKDIRVTVAISSALGLLGTGFISDVLTAWVKRRARR